MRRFAFMLISASIGILAIGCESADSNQIAVTGEVFYDGAPVQEGDILFLAADGVSGHGVGKIVSGKYAVETTPGEKIVEIRASRMVMGADPENPGSNLQRWEMYVPAKYNAASELKQTVPSGGGEIVFNLAK